MRVTTAKRFRGRFTLPGDKSVSHRLALLAALARGTSRLGNFSTAADCASTLRCLEGLGVETRRGGRSVEVLGRGPEGLRAPSEPLDAGNSGSTLRMLAGVAAGRPFRTVITGDASLLRRPVERVAEPLRAMGARTSSEGGRPPLVIEGGRLKAIDYAMAVPSAQVKSAVLLAGLQAEGRTTVREAAPSRDHTERLLPAFGVSVDRPDPLTASVEGGAMLQPVAMEVPGDVSSAAFLVVAALICPDAFVHVEGILLNPRRTAFIDVLRAMGGLIEMGVRDEGVEPVGWIEARSSHLHGTRVTAERVPSLIDELPAMAAAAACAEGTFEVAGAGELRVKESDRIATIAAGLRAMGAEVEERPDGFTVHGGRPLHGARVRAHDDHRIAMALAVAGLRADGETEIEDGECVAVSFPEFPALIERGCRGGR